MIKPLLSENKNDQNSDASLRFELIAESNKVVEVIPKQIKPFSFADLQNAKGSDNSSIKFKITTDNINLESIGEQAKGSGTVSGNIIFHNKPKVFTLVDGGWLPPALVSPSNYLVDRNVVSILAKLNNGSTRADHQSTDWWLKFPGTLNTLIHPLLYAIEGNRKEIPTSDDFHRSFLDASKIIKSQLPNATVIDLSMVQYEACYELLTSFFTRLENESKFLVSIAKTIANRPADKSLLKSKDYILQASDSFGLNKRSIVVLAALSCIYEPRDGSGFLAAREVLKPKSNYLISDAYNAISDLRALELFIAFSSIDSQKFHLCTCDRGLAGLWCGLNPRNACWIDGMLTFDLSIDESLFPRLKAEYRNESNLLE